MHTNNSDPAIRHTYNTTYTHRVMTSMEKLILDYNKELNPGPVVCDGYPQGHTKEVGKEQVELTVTFSLI